MDIVEYNNNNNLVFPMPFNTEVIFKDTSDVKYKYIHNLTTPDCWYGRVYNLENICILCNQHNCTEHIIRVFEKFDDEIICLFNFYMNDNDSDSDTSNDTDSCTSDENENKSDNFNLEEIENELVSLDDDSDESSDVSSNMSINIEDDIEFQIFEVNFPNEIIIYNYEYISLDNVKEILTNRDKYEFIYDNDTLHLGFPKNENIITNEDENRLELSNDGEIWIRKLF